MTELTINGVLVITVVWFRGELPNFETHRPLLESIHFQKIRLGDVVVLIDRDAVGKHTKLELDYAKSIGKPILTYDSIDSALDYLELVFGEERLKGWSKT